LRKVAVTGIGVVSAIGLNREEFWQSLAAGRSGICPLEGIDPCRLRFRNAAQIRDFRPQDYFEERQASVMDRFSQLALAAARQAVADSNIEWSPELRRRTAVVMGCGVGGKETEEQSTHTFYGLASDRISPVAVVKGMPSASTSWIAMDQNLHGPAFTITTACASAAHAIGEAFWLVRGGRADLALAGGSEAPLTPCLLKAWESMRVISPDTCRPFCRRRSGMILGEGAGVLVLEPLDRAKARGAAIYAELAGFGMSSDAHHVTQPCPEWAGEAMRAALEDAGARPESVGYVNAHGTGTLANDPAESKAIRRVFGDHTSQVAVSSTKSMHGHTLGAAGAIEAAATALAISRSLIPPTANFQEPDPECDLNLVINSARPAEIECAISSSLAFGGLNAILVFRRAT